MPLHMNFAACKAAGLDNADVAEAMRRLGAYYDISVDDFREIYAQVWEIARKRLLHAISAAQIMTSPPLTVRVGQNLRQVLELFAARNITGLPVLDEEGKLCGVISEKDVSRVLCGTESGFSALALLTVLKRNVAELGKKLELPVGRIMSSPPLTARTDCPLGELIGVMRAQRVNRLPVLDQNGALQGIVSRSDIIQALEGLSC